MVVVDKAGKRHFTMDAETGVYDATGNAANEVELPVLPHELADGTYANLALIQAGHGEYVLDFARTSPGNERGKVVARVIVTPEGLMSLMAAIQEALDK